MPNNINRRVQSDVTHEARVAQQRALEQAAAQDQRDALQARTQWARDNASRFVGMSSLRLFLALRSPERRVIKQEQEWQANTEWLNREVAPIDNLCATFRRWATENGIPCNVGIGARNSPATQMGWHIRAIKTGERLEDHFDYDSRLPDRTTKHITGEHWFIPMEPATAPADTWQGAYGPMAQPGYNAAHPTFQNLMCEKTPEVEGDTLPAAYGYRATPLEIQYDSTWLNTAGARVEEGIYEWARTYPHLPFPED